MSGTVSRPAAVVVAIMLLLAGCSGRPSYRLNDSVEGTVTLDGAAIPNVMVQFIPDLDAKYQAPVSSGYTDDKGRFSLKCENGKSGAVIGKHNVVVMAGRDESGAASTRIHIPEAYRLAAQTPLKIEITADKHTYDLSLSSTR